MDEGTLKKTDLFLKGTFGYYYYRIPALAITKKGTILAACEARKFKSDWATHALVLRKSTDGGKNWSPMKPIVQGYESKPLLSIFKPKLKEIVNNPVFIIDQDGVTIHFIYIRHYQRAFYIKSVDEGESWSKPQEITSIFENYKKQYNWNVIASGPGKGIQLKNGRLIVPIWIAYGKGRAHNPNICGTIYSDDFGKSWQAGEMVPKNSQFKNLNECYAIELANGKVLLNMRNESFNPTDERHRLVSYSDDGAHNWTEPVFDKGLYEPTCMASLIRYSEAGINKESKNRILFSNPDSQNGRKRERLTIKLSEDEHKSWINKKVIEEGPSGYSDLAVSSEGTIYCLYERAESGSKNYSDKITISQFDLSWLIH